LVKRTRAIVKLCARYELLVNFHDHPVPPAGGSRTWPNLITREYCHAQSDARRAFQPETFVTSAIVNGISGALDMNNGYFELNGLMEQGRTAIGEPVPSTVVAEAARAFIVFSGLVVIPDHPDAYRAKADLFEFIANIRGSWDETKVIHAEIGKYITVARRKGDIWMIGSATNGKAREVEIDLDFLGKGTYELTQFSDGENASAFGDKEDYIVKGKTVHAGDTHHYKMAPGGGHCVLIKKK
ncbi:MAG: glycoside hydrolase family 97 C-terminal domain-containing protein, partial [Bacteroidales bacterium]|nr:glycoside hydrolase family 97 C-terminal domain-containing protein [Bacteroidales bacterium]